MQEKLPNLESGRIDKMEVFILRIGHRPQRDKRMSTHVALTARAFGAKGVYFDVDDEKLFEKIKQVSDRWGGDFFIEHMGWRKTLENFDGLKIHLTMYGIPLTEKIEEIKKANRVLVVVGAEKVPPDVYQLCDLNVAIGNQPHSEVAALAVFLDRLLDGKVFKLKFPDSKIRIFPSEREKRLEDKG
jgi:tRNA (cytidine56-2'-O)-methyltransferase